MRQKAASKDRQYLLQAYGDRYLQALFPHDGDCFYCGTFRQCTDHCPPLSWAYRWEPEKGPPHLLVPSCTNCNSRLAARPLFYLKDRLQFLERTLSAEYDRRFSLWSEKETAEMSPMFQKLIRGRRAQLDELHQRIVFLQKQALFDWEAELGVSDGTR